MAKRDRKRIIRIGLTVVATIAMVTLGAFGWQWVSGVMVEEIRIQGYYHAELDELRALVRVDSATAMIDVEPETVAADVEQHAWVRQASVTRWPTGMLQIKVEERVPVAIMMHAGAPAAYLDEQGFALPLVRNAVYHVPTISGLPAIPQAGQRAGEPVVELLGALDRVPREVSALIGDISYRSGEMWITTLPTTSGDTVPIRLGDRDFEQRLMRMHTFWHRAVVAQPDKQFALVDLRFDSQVVTRESERKR